MKHAPGMFIRSLSIEDVLEDVSASKKGMIKHSYLSISRVSQ